MPWLTVLMSDSNKHHLLFIPPRNQSLCLPLNRFVWHKGGCTRGCVPGDVYLGSWSSCAASINISVLVTQRIRTTIEGPLRMSHFVEHMSFWNGPMTALSNRIGSCCGDMIIWLQWVGIAWAIGAMLHQMWACGTASCSRSEA